ncbi:putative hydrolase of the HAD superfamily [Silvibacterium bohemicum]|uniref:Putative hydrolase of the HAD superfamily n=1 Tax=Silvibacterium bohemicum TaxID=1577686 RepID=A0A841JZW0_9BACT|nr:HAD family hydrolase [Silvibacterium bohemicum]MBB6143958.1 putative hydrolase of the HAD superfamily [Silvibacterium bohemicum]
MSIEVQTYAPGQTLLIDADDTLWENNIYFERAIAAFISYVNHREYTREEVREKLNEVERENTRLHGYGLSSFRNSLVICFERLSGEKVSPEKHERIVSFAESVADQDIELLPGVAETLAELASRHRLILMTKGNQAEQADKLARSGLASYFAAVEIPKEKNCEAYCDVCVRHELAPHTTWMIGNSPRSDINPALAAGLHAIYIHHPSTWVLEHDAIGQPSNEQKLLELEAFSTLVRYF